MDRRRIGRDGTGGGAGMGNNRVKLNPGTWLIAPSALSHSDVVLCV